MRFEFKLPDIGEGVVEGEITAWHVQPGDDVGEDQPLVEVMTDKATVTIPSPHKGKVVETVGKVGDLAKVHDVLLVIEVLDGGTVAAGGHGGALHEQVAAQKRVAEPLAAVAVGEKPTATPATRKLARDLGIDLAHVPASGDGGRVTNDDVKRFAEGGAPAAAAPRAPSPAAAPGDRRIPFVGLRRKIAEKMAQSKRTAAHFTFVEECDMTALVELRARTKARAEAEGWKVSYLPFIVKAVCQGLRRHPMLNATLDEAKNDIVLRGEIHVGIAAATDAGLIVPVVKNADRLSIKQIAQEIDRMANDARAGKSRIDDLRGSTFTITSLGAQGGLFATPIINFPEVGILGVHQIKKKPVVRGGQIMVGDVMLLSLSFDHRIIDGHVGAAFAYDVIRSLEDPTAMFLDMV